MKKKWPLILILLGIIVFLLIPLPASNLILRITLAESHPIDPHDFFLYYAMEDQIWSEEQKILGSMDEKRNVVSFQVSSSLEGHLTGLRIDFPAQQQLVGVENITVSSAGFPKKQYNPCVFFDAVNQKAQNGLYGISLVPTRARAYIGTTPEDPYIILSDALTGQITGLFSHYRMTRFFICLFASACCLSYQKKLFKE